MLDLYNVASVPTKAVAALLSSAFLDSLDNVSRSACARDSEVLFAEAVGPLGLLTILARLTYHWMKRREPRSCSSRIFPTPLIQVGPCHACLERDAASTSQHILYVE